MDVGVETDNGPVDPLRLGPGIEVNIQYIVRDCV